MWQEVIALAAFVESKVEDNLDEVLALYFANSVGGASVLDCGRSFARETLAGRPILYGWTSYVAPLAYDKREDAK